MLLRNGQSYRTKEFLKVQEAIVFEQSPLLLFIPTEILSSLFGSLYLSSSEVLNKMQRTKSKWFLWRRNIRCLSKRPLKGTCTGSSFEWSLSSRFGTKESKRKKCKTESTDMRVHFNLKGFGHCFNGKHSFLTLLKPNEARPDTGQSSLDLTHSKLVSHLLFCSAPTRDSGTQLARGTNWIQSCSLQAKKWAIQPRTDGILCSVLSLPLPSAPISNLSPLLLSVCFSAVKQVRVLVEEAMRQSTDWQLSGE